MKMSKKIIRQKRSKQNNNNNNNRMKLLDRNAVKIKIMMINQRNY